MSQDGRPDVLRELDNMLLSSLDEEAGDVYQLVRILRAADVLWNLDRRPVLCLMEGETLVGVGAWFVFCLRSG